MASAAWSHEDGAPPGHTGGFGEPTCVACHFDNGINSQDGEITLDGLPASFIPCQPYEFVVVVKHPRLRSGGFQLTVRDTDGEAAGALSATGKRVQSATDSKSGSSYAQHSKDGMKADAEGLISWLVRWKAPGNEKEIVINVAANAANDDASALGDYIYFLEKRLKAAARPDASRYPQ